MSADERSWVEAALRGSHQVLEERLRLPTDSDVTIILFNRDCRFEAKSAPRPHWIGTSHDGKISLPDGGETQAAVTAFASRVEETGERFFVMALPSIWRAAGIIKANDDVGLIGVFLHEYSHVRQVKALQPRFEDAEAIYRMPEDFSDDSLQEHFQSDPAYAAVVEKEIDLLYRAAEEPDPVKARELARQSLALTDARQKRWFVGQDAKWKPYDDLFLTMEGFGQWVGYAWLSDPAGGGMTPAAAKAKMRGSGRWWSQEQGLAMFLVIDRFLPDWARRAFARQSALGLELLRSAVSARHGASLNGERRLS